LAAVSINGLWGYIDRTGREVISPKFIYASAFSGGYARVDLTDRSQGVIDRNGRIVLSRPTGLGFTVNEGLIPFRAGPLPNSEGYIDITGRMVISPQFDWVRPFRHGHAWVNNSNGWGLIDRSGKFIIQPQFSDITSAGWDLYAVQSNGRWGIIDKVGRVLVSPQFDKIDGFIGDFTAVEQGGRRLIIDRGGRILLDPTCNVQR